VPPIARDRVIGGKIIKRKLRDPYWAHARRHIFKAG
jgi:hypothetical protein